MGGQLAILGQSIPLGGVAVQILVESLDHVRVAVHMPNLWLLTQPDRELFQAIEVLRLGNAANLLGLYGELHRIKAAEMFHPELCVVAKGISEVEGLYFLYTKRSLF